MFKKSKEELKIQELQLKIDLINTLKDLKCSEFAQCTIDSYIKDLVIDVIVYSKDLGRRS